MTKEEILARSREENKDMDEREEQIMFLSHSVSNLTGSILCLAISIISWIAGGPEILYTSGMMLLWAMIGSAAWVKVIKEQKRSHWFSAILLSIVFAVHAIDFIQFFISGV